MKKILMTTMVLLGTFALWGAEQKMVKRKESSSRRRSNRQIKENLEKMWRKLNETQEQLYEVEKKQVQVKGERDVLLGKLWILKQFGFQEVEELEFSKAIPFSDDDLTQWTHELSNNKS